MALPRPLARAVAWAVSHRSVALPALFAVLVAANLVAFAWLAPPLRTGAAIQVEAPGPGTGGAAPLPGVDTDADGVPDLDELYRFGTDPGVADTDGDGLPDAWEAEHRDFDAISGDFVPDPVVADGDADPDHDGATNLEEYAGGSDPNEADTDGDDLPDGWELETGLDPRVSNRGLDTDSDGASDHEEFLRGTHPARVDSDLDGLPDAREVELGTDPSRYSSRGSGVADGWLVVFGLDPTSAEVAYEDADGDGMTVQDEFNWSATRFDFEQDLSEAEAAALFRKGLDPRVADTDSDGAGDGWEVRYGLDPLTAGDGGDDLDGDTLTNAEEFAADSNPRAIDTDGDGLTDPDEARVGWTVRIDERDVTVFSDPSRRDSDGDGLSDPEERQGFAVRSGARVDFCPTGPCPLNPKNPDSDLDGLPDGAEIVYEVSPRLNPLVADTDGDSLPDGAEVLFWEQRARTVTPDEVGRLIAEIAAATGVRPSPQEARDRVGPRGDVDGDGVPNLVDADSDGDKLEDGLEVAPAPWRSAPGSDLRFPFPATDPLFKDSDGDGLVDAWEKEFTRWDVDCGLWNLDPSRVNSYLPCSSKNDGKTDATRDLDGDGVRYEATGYQERRSFVFTNILEQAARTDPNDADTDGDRIVDGWEAYFTDIGRRAGVPVGLDPTDGSDANDTSKTLSYLRFAGSATGGTDPRPNETVLDTYLDIGMPLGGSQTVVVLAGTRHVTFLEEFLAATDPTVTDTDGDGLSDAWEFHWTTLGGFLANDATNPFNPLVDTASKDPDQDTLTNLQEAEVVDAEGRAGLCPVCADTDLGGITDEKELGELGPEGPLDPRNDNLGLDSDGDGLTNGQEAFEYHTSPSLADTDRDGLLDGGNIDLDLAKPAEAAKARRFDQQGIVARLLSNTVWRYYGEGKLAESDRTDPTKADTDGDGLPDGWESFYRLPTRIYTAGATSDGDPLDDTTEYRLGMPPSWDERRIWWFGGDPTRIDTDGDGADARDGAFDRLGRRVGDDLDYDNDGLGDLTGEDPFPFYDHNNTGRVAVTDPAVARAWVVGGARTRTHLLDRDGDRIPDGADLAPALVRDLKIVWPGTPGVLPKGGSITVTGKLVATTNAGEVPAARALVVANIDAVSGDPTRVLGIALTRADGTFSLDVGASPTRSYELPEGGNVTVFGRQRAGGEEVQWTLNTSLIQPRATDRRVVLWNYAIGVSEQRATFRDVPCGSLVATYPIDCSSSFDANGLRSGFDRPTDLGTAVKIKTATTFELPAGGGLLRAENGGNLTGTGRLVDGAGDGVPTKSVSLTWRSETKTVTTKEDGTFPISFRTGSFERPGLYDVQAQFVGDGDRVFESVTTVGRAAVAFDTVLRASVRNPNLVVAAGTPLIVEGTLADHTGEPVPSATVRVKFVSEAVENTTGLDGSFRIEVLAPENVLAGTQRVVVEYEGDDLHKASSLERPIHVTIKQKTRIVLAGGDHPITKALVIEGALLDAGNASVKDPTSRQALTVRIVGPDFTVDAPINENGVFATVVDAARLPGVGSFGVRVSFPGSPLYASTSVVAQWRIVSTTLFDLPDARVARGTDAAVAGRVLDGRGDGVPQALVAITFGDRSLGTVLTNGSGHFVAPVTLPAASPLGPVRVRATYNGTGDGLYAASSPGAATYHVVARTRIVLPDRDVPSGEFVLQGSLLDDGGAAVGGEEVRLTLDGVDIGRARTDFEGAFETVVDPACVGTEGACARGGVLARTYAVRATYPGSFAYAASEAKAVARVLARTELVVDDPGPLARGQDAVIRGRLLQEDGHGVPRASIAAILGGADRNVTIGRALTLPNGSFEIKGPLPASFPRGPAPLRVVYAGDANRRAAEETLVVEVVSPTHIQLKLPNRLGVGDAFTGTIVLVDDEGRPVPNAVVRVHFSGYPYPFTLKTNETGETSFPGKIVASGPSEVAVRFAGAGTLLGATESSRIHVATGIVTGAEGRNWALAIAASLLAVGLASVLVARYRRRQIREARRWIYEAEAGLLAGDEYVATILTAYRRLTEHFVRYGYVPRPDVTSREFVGAARAAMPSVREGPLDDLVRLFDEARYSQHPVGAAERDAAVRALAAINRDLLDAGRGRRKEATP